MSQGKNVTWKKCFIGKNVLGNNVFGKKCQQEKLSWEKMSQEKMSLGKNINQWTYCMIITKVVVF